MTTRVLPFLLVLLGMALPVAAQTPPSPRFLLETIVVEGTQRDAVREIVAAESLLQPGREYSEQELREAVYRVKRLPFVLDAEFSLRKGGERGTYQLVITVEETRLVFYSADAGGLYDGYDRSFFPGEERVDWGASVTAGGRWFVGSQGLVFGSVQGVDDLGPAAAQIGYTRYNLFGRGGFASVTLWSDVSDETDGDVYQGSVSTDIPIVGSHTFHVDLNWFRFREELFGSTFRSDSRSLTLAWVYDTTDDPLFATSGDQVFVGARYAEDERESEDPFFGDFRDTGNLFGAYFGGIRYWALTHRQAVSAEVGGSWDQADSPGLPDSYERWAFTVGLGHSLDLWGFEKTERIGDFRWENNLWISSYDNDNSEFNIGRSTEGRLLTSLVFRNAWGVLRGSFTYVDVLEDGR